MDLRKRRSLQLSAVALAGLASGISHADNSSSSSKTVFVLVHGAWHGAWTYERVTPFLARRGLAAVARDLPAHGLNARFPASYFSRPLDAAAFAGEPSPVAAVTLDDYVDSVIDTIDQVRRRGKPDVVLVGHSLGGIVITAAAQRAPEKISKLVYLTAFMPSAGVPMIVYVQSAENQGELVAPQFLANPADVGALRIDHNSSDASYRSRTQAAFYNDVSQADFDAVANLMTPDVPLGPVVTAIDTTPGRWGRVPRYYIRCTHDNAIKIALQDRFIAEADAAVPGNQTRVLTLNTSHSPFISAPKKLADLLSRIAAS